MSSAASWLGTPSRWRITTMTPNTAKPPWAIATRPWVIEPSNAPALGELEGRGAERVSESQRRQTAI